jgi:hypothetical protein
MYIKKLTHGSEIHRSIIQEFCAADVIILRRSRGVTTTLRFRNERVK